MIMNQKGFGNMVLIGVVIVILVIGGYFTLKGKQQTHLQQNTKISANVTIADLVSFFNSKFDCSPPNDPNIDKDCFNNSFKSKSASSTAYDNPLYQMVDFTGDGFKDALVTIYYSGSGAMRDFYALTKDPAISGSSNGNIKIAYEKGGVGFLRSASDWSNSNGSYNLNCSDSDRNGQPDCTIVINWDTNNKTFTTLATITQPSPAQKSGIRGTVIGEYCNGIERVDPPPGYKPCGEEFLTSFSLKIKNDISGIDKQVTTDSTGKFQIELSPEKYTITQASENQAYGGGAVTVEVKSGVFTDIQLKFQEYRP